MVGLLAMGMAAGAPPASAAAPVVTGTRSPAPSPFGWNREPVVVSWTATPAPGDPPIAAPPDTLVSAEGTTTVTSDPACDGAGSCATGSLTVQIDLTDPVVNCLPNQVFDNGQPGAAVLANVGDTVSGPNGGVASTPVSTAVGGLYTVDVTGYDFAGRSTTVSCEYYVLEPHDPLTATITTPAEGQVFSQGQVVDAVYRCGGPYDWCIAWVDNNFGSRLDTSRLGTHSFQVTATDASFTFYTTTTHSYTVVPAPDETPPVVTGTPDRAPDANGWYRAPVTIDWTASDPAPSSGQPGDPPDTVVSTEGVRNVTSDLACDGAGNCTSGVHLVRVDLTDPVVTCPATPAFGFGDAGATLTATVTDALAGPESATVTVPAPTAAAGFHTVDVTGTDRAGRTTTVSCDYVVMAPPDPLTATIDVPAEGQVFAQGQVVNAVFHCGGPYDYCLPWVDNRLGETRLDTSTLGVHYFQVTATDGTFTTFTTETHSYTVVAPPDEVPPLVTGTPDRAPNANGWYDAPVTVDWTAIDPAPSSGQPTDPPDTTVATEGASAVSGTACDGAGNCATAWLTVKVDLTDPVVQCPATPRFSGRQPTGTLTVTVVDAGSGPEVATIDVVVATDVVGTQIADVTATDRAGRQTFALCLYEVVAPVSVALATPADGETFDIGQHVVSAFTCGGPTAYCLGGPGTEPVGAVVDTSVAGTYTYTALASNDDLTDIAYVTHTYHVVDHLPGPPRLVGAGPTNGGANVVWSPPVNTGSAVTDYLITPYLGGVAQPPRAVPGTATSAAITGLTNGQTYTFRITAVNGAGGGPASAATAPVVAGMPKAPTGVTAVSGDASAKVGWTAAVANGAPITSYTVTPYVGGVAKPATTFASSATSQTVTGLTNGTTYTFRVTAQNAYGTSLVSAPSAPVVVGLPGVPRLVGAGPGNALANVIWYPPAGGAPVTGYVVTPYRNGVAQTPVTFGPSATGGAVTGLTNGAAYTFVVTARSAAGLGAPAAASAPIVVGAPKTPTGVTATAGPGSVTVRWTAPASNGSPLTGYVLTPYLAGVAQAPITFASTATSQTLTGLAPGGRYTFKVAARNAVGTGPASALSAVAIPT